MKSTLILLLMSCHLLLYKPAQSQQRFSSIGEIWEYADLHNITLKTAEAGIASADLSRKQAYGALLPSVTAGGTFTDNMTIQSTLIPASLFNPSAPPDLYTEASFGRRYIYNGSVSVQVDMLNMQDWFRISSAGLNREMAVLHLAKAKTDLYEQLANAYFSCILLSEAERLSAENERTAGVSFRIATDKFNEGVISEVTLNAALINKEKAEKNREIAAYNKTQQLNNLKQLLQITDSIALGNSFDQASATERLNAFAPDPAVQLAHLQLRVSKNGLGSARSAFVPTLSAVYQYNAQVAADRFLKFENSNTLPQQYWGLRLSIPVFTGNTRRYEVQKARIDVDTKQKEFESASLQSAIGDQNLLIAYNSAVAACKRSKKILELYQRNDVHAERRLNEGLISMDDRLKSYADLVTSENEYLQSLNDLLIQQYRVKIRQIDFTKNN